MYPGGGGMLMNNNNNNQTPFLNSNFNLNPGKGPTNIYRGVVLFLFLEIFAIIFFRVHRISGRIAGYPARKTDLN